jgi:hypothetical protein
MELPPREAALVAIRQADVKPTAERNATRLLSLAAEENGCAVFSRETICELFEVKSWRVAQRYLTEFVDVGLIHYSTNERVYVSFHVWPECIPYTNTVYHRHQYSVSATPPPYLREADEGVQNTPIRCTTDTKTVYSVHPESAYKELNERMNDLSLSPTEIDQSIAILTSPEIRMSRTKAQAIANAYPFLDIRAFSCDFVAQAKEPGTEAGLIVYWLEAAETIPPLHKNDLWYAHRTQAEIQEEVKEREEAAALAEKWAAEDAARQQAPAPTPPPTEREGAPKAAQSPGDIWASVLQELARTMPGPTYDAWIRDTDVLSYADGEFVIGVPHAHARDWLDNRLKAVVKRNLSRLVGRAVDVKFQVRERIAA